MHIKRLAQSQLLLASVIISPDVALAYYKTLYPLSPVYSDIDTTSMQWCVFCRGREIL
jgi:hypothetical protein